MPGADPWPDGTVDGPGGADARADEGTDAGREARGDARRGEVRRTVCLGVVADPGLPSDIAGALVDERLSRLLGDRVSDEVEWQVQLVREALPLNAHGTVPILDLAAERKPDAGWDLLVYLTDLPRLAGTRPVAADISTSHGVSLVSLPAIGWLRLRRHVTETLVHLVHRMYQGLPADRRTGRGRPGRRRAASADDARAVASSRSGRLLRRTGEWVSPVREMYAAEEDIDTSLALVGRRGRLRLLCGMVRNNRPWLLVPHLAGATAAAAATAAFGIFYSSIWNMADALSPARLALITVLAVAAMVIWLLLYNHLWDSPSPYRAWKNTALYNASTLCTLTLGVACMYVLLYVLSLLAAVVVIDSGYLAARLGHPVGPGDYATLVWLASSMGIVAGALGSSLNTEAAVRQATYSRRERERQEHSRVGVEQVRGRWGAGEE